MFSRRLITTSVLMTVLVAGCSESQPTGTPPTIAGKAGPSTSATPSKPATRLDALTADQLAEKAESAAEAAVGVRVRATMTTDDGRPLTFDLGLTRTAASGTLTINGARLKIRIIGRTVYLQASDAYWRQNTKPKKEADMVIEMMRGKWLKVALTDEKFGQLTTFVRKSALFFDLFDHAVGSRKAGTKTVGGIPCIGLVDAQGNTLWVDATNARPIRLDQPGKSRSERMTFTFSEYNQIKEPKAPPAAQITDGKSLGI
ncbi:hypothetical protein ACIBGM_25350 [Kribbella sp. NPDC050470]